MSQIIASATGLELRIHKRIEWQVKNFRTLLNFPDVMSSQRFHFRTEESNNGNAHVPSLKWRLLLTCKDNAVAMWYEPATADVVKAKLPFTILYECRASVEMKIGVNKTEFKHKSVLTFTTENQGYFPKTCFFIMGKDIIPHLSTTVEDEAITIHFMVSIYSRGNTNPKCINSTLSTRTGDDKLRTWNLHLLKSGDNADVKIISKDAKEFPAHKLILSRIPGFAHKFKRQTEDMRSGIVRQHDLSSAAVEFLLHYIYSDEIPPFTAESIKTGAYRCDGDGDSDDTIVADTRVSVHEVLHMAKKFVLTCVHNHVDQCLHTMLTMENAKTLYYLSDSFKLRNASKRIWQYLVQNNHPEYLERKRQRELSERCHARFFESDFDFSNPR